MKILVIGATGNIGSKLTRLLRLQHQKPYVGVRDKNKAKDLFKKHVFVRKFDHSKPATFEKALKGMDKVFAIAPPKGAVEWINNFLPALKKAAVQHFVFSSGRTTGDEAGLPLFEVENKIRASGLPYTILRPGWFMQNFNSWIFKETEDAFYLPAENTRTAFVDVRDIAAVAAKVLLESGHEYKNYELTSDEALTHYEVAEKISDALGKAVQYIALNKKEYAQKMKSKGWSAKAIDHTNMLYDLVKTGKEAKVSKDVEQILHRLPISFDEYVADYFMK